VENSLVSEGCLIRGASIRQSVIGVRSVLREGAQIERTVFMGADEYDQYPIFQRAETGLELGVGRGTLIRGAIVDKNARIGRNCQIVNEADVQTADHDLYAIREGVIVVRKNAVIPDGTVI
jgi:glucose-1-phosphate adenylyltransferase